jgi:hexosaminidase
MKLAGRATFCFTGTGIWVMNGVIMQKPQLLPAPRVLKLQAGQCLLPETGVLLMDASLDRATVMLPLAERLMETAAEAGIELELSTGPRKHPRLLILAEPTDEIPDNPEAYTLSISKGAIKIGYGKPGGLRAGIATLRQLLRQYGRKLPCLDITDYPDFARRGVMLDISRGKVPNLATLLDLVEHLADFKINEFQLYIEHTFAYRNYEEVWSGWGPITGEEVLLLDARCRELGIDLVPNQNSFGHLRYWLENPGLKKLSEVDEPYEGTGGTFLRYPTTLAPENAGTLPFIRELYDEFLPHFTSRLFNVGCDETWDLGRGQSKEICEARGKHQVYVDFLKKIYKEVKGRGRQMMFWGDIIMHEPELIKELPEDTIALNWGYEANHPFEKETAIFGSSGRPFYVCPGTSTWMTLIGRLDNALPNLELGCSTGRKNGAMGCLICDWGDGGHPQPLAVSWIPYLAGASMSWCQETYSEKLLGPVLSREVFHDPTGNMAKAAFGMGFAHLKFKYLAPNITPFGSVIAAPIPETKELMCRDGLKYYARIPEKNIHAAVGELEKQRGVLKRSEPTTIEGEVLKLELEVASQMALESCHIMLWQQALVAGKRSEGRQMARRGVKALGLIDEAVREYWPIRNKGDTGKSTAFLQWRIEDYKRGVVHFPPELAQAPKV